VVRAEQVEVIRLGDSKPARSVPVLSRGISHADGVRRRREGGDQNGGAEEESDVADEAT
jgi:hypothetical protein